MKSEWQTYEGKNPQRRTYAGVTSPKLNIEVKKHQDNHVVCLKQKYRFYSVTHRIKHLSYNSSSSHCPCMPHLQVCGFLLLCTSFIFTSQKTVNSRSFNCLYESDIKTMSHLSDVRGTFSGNFSWLTKSKCHKSWLTVKLGPSGCFSPALTKEKQNLCHMYGVF